MVNSVTGVFKNLFLEFEEQLKIVIKHFYESTDTKFNSAYVVRKLEELCNVYISKSQCHRYLGRLHNLVKPRSRALIKFTSKKKRIAVSHMSPKS